MQDFLANPKLIFELIIALAVFGLVLSVWVIGLLVWRWLRLRRAARLGQRLGLVQPKSRDDRQLHLWRAGEHAVTTVPGRGPHRSLVKRLESESERAGLKLSGVGILLLSIGVFAGTGACIVALTRNVPLALGLAVASVFVLHMYLQHRIDRRAAVFERQFVDALDLSARSLRAGHPLMGAFQLVSDEMQPPVSKLFGEICQQHEMGANVEDVLRTAAERSASRDMKLFATSVAIQMRSGGNLANLMHRLSGVIRDRIRLSRRVRVLTAQTQMSKRVLLFLPFALFVLLSAINPDYMMPFYTTTPGRIMLSVGLVLLAAGAWIMNRMVDIRY